VSSTVNELFAQAVSAHAERVALRMLIPKERRKGQGVRLILNEISYARLGEMAARLAGALDELGVKKGDRVAVIAKPRASWATAFFATLLCGGAVVPLDPGLQEGEVERILNEAQVKAVVVSGTKIPALLAIKQRAASDFALISMDRPKEEDVLFLDALVIGRKPLSPVAVDASDLAILMYTSGTMGNAKGAMLTHANIATNAQTCAKVVDLSPTDNFLTIVPWYHIYGLTVTLITPLISGGTTTYAPVDPNLTQVMLKANPTILLGVPKLYHVLYSKVRASIEKGGVKKLLDRLAPRLMGWFVKRKLFGRRFRFFTSGGAPLSPDVAIGFRRMGIGVMEGYGLTETSPVLTMCEAFAPEPGMIAIPEVEIRVAHPDDSGIGEVLARGPSIMAGYYKNPEATAEVIDDDGWFHTGDLGRMDGDRLLLSGRAKNVIVLETGKNVYPEEVEWELATLNGIEEIMVYEGQRQGAPAVAAKIYPNWTALKDLGIAGPEEALDYFWEEIRTRCENLALYKRIKNKDMISLVDEPFEKSVKLDIKRYVYQEPDQ